MNLLKKLFRDVWEAKGQFLAIILAILLGSAVLTGLSSASQLLREYTDNYYSEYNLADIWMYYSSITSEDTESISDIEGVEDYELRFTFQQTLLDKTLQVYSFDENTKINRLFNVDGTLPENPFEIAIDYEFALANDLSLGEDISYIVDGTTIEYTITAFIENPEYVIKLPNDGNGFPEHEIYGVAYVHYSTIPELSALIGIPVTYDEIIVTLKEGLDANAIIREIEKTVPNEAYLLGYTREQNSGYSMLSGDIEQYESLGYIFPVVFYLVAALMTYIAMRRIIDSQKIQIGIMKALGVKKAKIMAHYILFPVLPCTIGSFVGGIIGSIALPEFLIKYMFAETYDLPGITTKVFLSLVIPAIIISTGLGVLAAHFSCHKTLKLSASSAMRPFLPKSGKKILLERVAPIWNNFSGSTRIVYRNIFCNKKRAFMSCVGVVGSVALMMTAFAMKDSTALLIEQTYNDIYRYDGIVNFSYFTSDHGNITLTDVKSIPVPENTEVLYVPMLNFEVKDENKTTLGTVVVLDHNSDFYRSVDSNMNEITIPDNGIIISKRLAESHGLSIGDELEVKLTDSNYGGKSFTGTITAISEQYITQDIYCTSGFLEQMDIEPLALTMLVNLRGEATIDDIKDFYDNEKAVSSVVSLAEQKESIENYTEVMNSLVAILVVAAMLLSFSVIYNISLINLLERRTTLATMKVLGYRKNKIAKVFEYENMFLTMFGVMIGIPLGFLLMKAVFDASATDEKSFPYFISTLSIILSCGLAVLFTFISNLPIRRKIKNINMTETLKLIE